MKLKILQLFSPASKSLPILLSFLDLLIDDTIFIHLHKLVEPLPIRRPFNVLVWFHFSLLCRKGVISEPTIQAMLKSIDPKPFPNIQASGRDFMIGSTSRKMLIQ